MDQTLRRVLLEEVVGELLYAPVWWYTRGAWQALQRLGERIHTANDYLGLSVWVRNIFVPMYGQYDLAGRLISFGIRVAQILARGVVFAIWISLLALIFLAYLALPLVVLAHLFLVWILP